MSQAADALLPMPRRRPAPVTIATLPSSSGMLFSFRLISKGDQRVLYILLNRMNMSSVPKRGSTNSWINTTTPNIVGPGMRPYKLGPPTAVSRVTSNMITTANRFFIRMKIEMNTTANAVRLRRRVRHRYVSTRRKPASHWAASIVGDRGLVSGELESAGVSSRNAPYS